MGWEGREGLGEGEELGNGEERRCEGIGKGGSWGNSALVVGGIDAPAAVYLRKVTIIFNFHIFL